MVTLWSTSGNIPQTDWSWYVTCHRTLFLHVFFVHFRPNFTSHSLPHTFLPYAYFNYVHSSMCLCLHAHEQDDKNTIRLVQPDTEQLDYWTTDIPKQSCCGPSSLGSCTGTSSAATERSHHSKFRTSRTQSTSRSASIARILLVIDRFLTSTAARLPRPTVAMQRAASSDLARDASFLTGTGKVVTPSTRFTARSSYRIFVRMIHLPDKMFQRNAALADTHGERNNVQKDRSRNRKRRGILGRRKIVHQKVFFGLFQCHRYDFLVCLFGTDLPLFELFKLYFHLGLITTPHAFYVHMTYVNSLFLMFHSSRDHMTKRSHYRIMIFSTLEYGLFYGRTPTLIFFYFLRNPTTPILSVYVDQRRPHLEKDTTRTGSMIVWEIPTVPGRTLITPD